MPPAKLLVAVLVAVSGAASWTGAQETASFAREDPAKIATAERCGECHAQEYEVWSGTPHATSFKTLHRLESAETIAGRMGFRLIKRDALCLNCHYTTQVRRDQLRASAGVSCESCHGAGKDWIDSHNDYGPGGSHIDESSEHRLQRIEESRQAGMRRPSDLYPVGANCFQCHLVPNEKLVNIGGHTTGTVGFELVERSQGAMRHNFLQSQLGGSKENLERPPERKRIMYFVGRALDLEFSVRGFAIATEQGIYAKSMQRRVRNAVAEIQDLSSVAEIPEAVRILTAARGVKVTLGNTANLLDLADRVGAETRRFVENHDGSQLAAIDPLVEGRGLPEPADPAPVDLATNTADGTPSAAPIRGAGDSEAPVAAVASGAAKAASPRAAAITTVSYEKRTRLRPPEQHKTLDAGACSGCHEQQNAWWLSDPHEGSAAPFHDQEPKNLQVARFYGLPSSQSTKGTQLCMDCHGTIVSGKERRDIWDGVSCQSCHGPADRYLEPHKEGEKSQGRRRAGFQKALGLGMKDLRHAETLALRCAGCHYITDPGLISTGHPTGKDFDLEDRLAKIQHWERPQTSTTDLAAGWAKVLDKRGGIPTVEQVEIASASSGGPSTSASPSSSGGPTISEARASRSPARQLPPRARPIDRSSISTAEEAGPLELPSFPSTDMASIEETLVLIKERLEILYQSIRRSSE